MTKYKVKLYMDRTYEVLKLEGSCYGYDEWRSAFRGSLADCEAYIRLHENGYM